MTLAASPSAPAYDDRHLYSLRGDGPAPLVNAATTIRLLFKCGNCLDIQLAAASRRRPQRKTPTPGERALLVTRQQSRTQDVQTVRRGLPPEGQGLPGQPFVFKSPTGSGSSTRSRTTDRVTVEYRPTPTGFTLSSRAAWNSWAESRRRGMRLPSTWLPFWQ